MEKFLLWLLEFYSSEIWVKLRESNKILNLRTEERDRAYKGNKILAEERAKAFQEIENLQNENELLKNLLKKLKEPKTKKKTKNTRKKGK